jgi:hypothetical protein
MHGTKVLAPENLAGLDEKEGGVTVYFLSDGPVISALVPSIALSKLD